MLWYDVGLLASFKMLFWDRIYWISTWRIQWIMGVNCYLLLCLLFDQASWVSGVFESRSVVAVFEGFSDSTGESVLNSLEAVYLSDVYVEGERIAVV